MAIALLMLVGAQTLFAEPALPDIPSTIILNITSYGAVGDGITTNTAAIQAAINAAGSIGGAVVQVPAGVYLSGPIQLTNRTRLQVETGATLKMLPYGAFPGTSNFIHGVGVHDVAVGGAGIIEGQGAAWWAAGGSAPKPNLLQFSNCRRVLVEGVQLRNPPAEHLAFAGASGDITIQDLTIDSPMEGPLSAIHLTGTNCLIRSCSINNASDDNIQILAGSGVAADIVITNCLIGNGHGLSIGSWTVNGVSNVLVTDCSFNGTQNGIRLKSDRDRGGVVRDITYRNIQMTNVRMPITLCSYYTSYGVPNNITPAIAASNGPQPLVSTTPVWQDITISNLTATTQNGYVAGIIWGRPEMAVSNVTLCDLDITASKTFDIYNARGVRFLNTRVTVPAGSSTHTLYNAGIILSNTPVPIVLDGLNVMPTTNVIALHNSPATSATPGLVDYGTRFALDRSILGMPGNLILSSKTAMSFELGAEPSQIAVGNNLVLRGTVDISRAAGFTNGIYTLFTCGALLLQDAVLGSRPLGYDCSLSTNTPGQVNLLVMKAQPRFSGWAVVADTLTLNAMAGIPDSTCLVLTSTNPGLPVWQWERVGTNQFDADGYCSITNVISPNEPQRYYSLQLP